MIKKLIAMFLFSVITASAFPVFAVDYDENEIYENCATLYPGFVNKIKEQDSRLKDNHIIYCIASIERKLNELGIELTEENFYNSMFKAVKATFEMPRNVIVRDALFSAFPDSIKSVKDGVIPKEFEPLYNTVKLYIFDKDKPVVTVSTQIQNNTVTILPHAINTPSHDSSTSPGAPQQSPVKMMVALFDLNGAVSSTNSITLDDSVSAEADKVSKVKIFMWDKLTLKPLALPYEVEIIKE